MKIRLLILIFACSVISAFGQQGSVVIDLTDSRRLITRRIDKKLVLRIIKDPSVDHENFGWVVEVNRRPVKPSSENLIYTNKFGEGADASQVAAWQFTEPESEFTAHRRFKVRGAPYIVEFNVIDPQGAGKAGGSEFLSGRLQIVWRRQSAKKLISR